MKNSQIQKLDVDHLLFRRTLVVYPHPDDEAFFGAGLIHRINSKGYSTRVVILTRGENSSLRYGLKAEDDLASIRQLELAKSMRRLGVKSYAQYDLHDGNVESFDAENIIKKEVENFLPSILLTFEPGGIYGHLDHINTTQAIINLYKKQRDWYLLYSTLRTRPEFFITVKRQCRIGK